MAVLGRAAPGPLTLRAFTHARDAAASAQGFAGAGSSKRRRLDCAQYCYSQSLWAPLLGRLQARRGCGRPGAAARIIIADPVP